MNIQSIDTFTATEKDFDAIRKEIERLDREAWLLENRNHPTAATTSRVRELHNKAQSLLATLPETIESNKRREDQLAKTRAKFQEGQDEYNKLHKPKLDALIKSISDARYMGIPVALEKTMIELISDIERHDATMNDPRPTSIPDAMKRAMGFHWTNGLGGA